MGRDIIDTLNLHFQRLGERVTCSVVKPFLPTLLIPARRIRIPTPITVHVDHCPDCLEDLGILRGLGLEPGQLERLGRLYGYQPGRKSSLCGAARLKIPAFAAASTEGLGREYLDHLCTCPQCRAQVYEYRQKLLDAMSSGASGAEPEGCRGMSMAGAFDYVVAYDRMSAGSGAMNEADPPAGMHVRSCLPCMERLQAMHRMVYSVADRPESGVATVYTTVAGAKNAPAPDDLYANYPIKVEVIHRQAQPAVARRRRPTAAAGLIRTAFHPRTRSLLLKAAVVALAALPLTLLYLSTPTAAGVTLSQVFKAFDKAENVHISSFYGDPEQLIYEYRISRPSGIMVLAAGRSLTLYNLRNRQKKQTDLSSGVSGVVELSEQELAGAQKLADRCIGFTLGDIPSYANWRQISTSSEGFDVYELTWTERTESNREVPVRHEITVDPSTKLPVRMYSFIMEPGTDGWRRVSRLAFDYPTDDEMRAAIEQ